MYIGKRAIDTVAFDAFSKKWIGSQLYLHTGKGRTLDVTAFTAGTHYPKNYLPSGTPLALNTTTGLWGPYAGTSDEVQTVTEGGSGLTSFTLTYSGQTTVSIAAAATAAVVQAALEGLSNIAPGDVTVTGANGGPYTVTFGGSLADTNVAQMTATPTGGTGTVTVATQTAGGAEVTAAFGTLGGFLYEAERIESTWETITGSVMLEGQIKEEYLPFPVDANGWTDLGARFTRV